MSDLVYESVYHEEPALDDNQVPLSFVQTDVVERIEDLGVRNLHSWEDASPATTNPTRRTSLAVQESLPNPGHGYSRTHDKSRGRRHLCVQRDIDIRYQSTTESSMSGKET